MHHANHRQLHIKECNLSKPSLPAAALTATQASVQLFLLHSLLSIGLRSSVRPETLRADPVIVPALVVHHDLHQLLELVALPILGQPLLLEILTSLLSCPSSFQRVSRYLSGFRRGLEASDVTHEPIRRWRYHWWLGHRQLRRSAQAGCWPLMKALDMRPLLAELRHPSSKNGKWREVTGW